MFEHLRHKLCLTTFNEVLLPLLEEQNKRLLQ